MTLMNTVMKKGWIRKLICGLSFGSALFIFQACYGTPQDPRIYNYQYFNQLGFSEISQSQKPRYYYLSGIQQYNLCKSDL